MANSFTAQYEDSVERFWTTLAANTDGADWTRYLNLRTDNATSLKVSELRTTGTGGYTDSWSGSSSPTVKDFTSVGATAVTPVAYAKRMVISKHDAEDNPMIMEGIAAKFANEAAAKLAKLGSAALSGAFSASHPTIAGKNVVDTFVTPISQGNKGSFALSLSSLSAVRAAIRRLKNHDGDVVAMPQKILVVPPELESEARQLLRSELTGDGSASGSNLINPFAGAGVSPEPLVDPLLSDTDDWYLVTDAKLNPMRAFAHLWLRSPFDFRVSEVEDTKQISFHTDFRAALVYVPECELDIYGSTL